MAMAAVLLLFFFFFSKASASGLTMGINYGRVANNLPSPAQTVALVQHLRIGNVKIFDTDPAVLSALANTGLRVAIAVTNDELPSLASGIEASDQWVQQNVVAHYPATLINFIIVGNEVLTDYDNETLWYRLVPAMQNVYSSLCKFKLGLSIKVSTSSALNILSSSFPPSSGSFRDDISSSVVQPLLQFLTETKSYFFVNVYPYLTWATNSQDIPLAYAIFDANANALQDGALQYDNLLDAQLDAVVAAMARLGYRNVKLAISETGWPTYGDVTQPGANIPNAAAYNRRLVQKMLAYPPIGTPLRPKAFIPTYMFALFNENEKPGPATERNWGLLYPNGSEVYEIDMTGRMPESKYAPFGSHGRSLPLPALPPPPPPISPTSGHPNRGQHQQQQLGQWCVSAPNASAASLQAAMDYACGQRTVFCEAIQKNNQPCFEPNSVASHASYAFNIYWKSMKANGGTCDFNGSAILTTNNPSYGSCEYP